MLVIEKAKTLALKLDNPARVLACVPTAKSFAKGCTNVVTIPHRQDETQVLRNLGIKAPAPILHYYDWPGQHTPYLHQRMTAAFLTMNTKAFVLNDIGTGKTLSALWAADYLMGIGAVKKVLVLSPLSTLERVWGDGIFMNFLHRRHVVLYGAANKRKKLLRQEADFYVINHDGFSIISDDVQNMFDLIIVDEAAVYRNSSAARFKRLSKWVRKQKDVRLWLMTGTPTPNSPVDAWALSKLADSPWCPTSMGHFRAQVMTKVSQGTWVPKRGCAELVSNIMRPAVRYSRAECLDLPPTLPPQVRQVPLTKEQKLYYDKMVKALQVEYASGTITAANEMAKTIKLVQIACGVVYNDVGEPCILDASPRLKALKEIIDEAGEKVIIFAPFTSVLLALHEELSKTMDVGLVYGAVSAKERNAIFHTFQNTAEMPILLANPRTMAHGLTLTAASTNVWYGPTTSNETYEQANGRIERIGKKFTTNVVQIISTPLERAMYKRLEGKQKLQGLLLDIISDNAE